MTQKAIEAKNIWKIYNQGKPNEVRALKGVDFSADEGQMLAIMGESGSGKTTLLNCISGIDNVTRGEIDIDGLDLVKMKDKRKTQYRAEKMGFVFQSFNLIPVLTAEENVELPLLINGIPAKESRMRAREILKEVGLGNRFNHKPSELSGGQRQRVTIARALVHKPKVIWADEPTGNLDSKTAEEVLKLLQNINKEHNTTIVMVTHSFEIAEYAEKIVKMDSGMVVR
ncbi:ABC transporter ATP-binding protein [Candidatus Nomurabacteria bacterium]|nr:ABC transporter ATP-binding protein [Candidatus Nomurabacteria bacterium]